jgi:hypothetical protein
MERATGHAPSVSQMRTEAFKLGNRDLRLSSRPFFSAHDERERCCRVDNLRGGRLGSPWQQVWRDGLRPEGVLKRGLGRNVEAKGRNVTMTARIRLILMQYGVTKSSFYCVAVHLLKPHAGNLPEREEVRQGLPAGQ